jgi:thiamine-phosphate diphosphorylase
MVDAVVLRWKRGAARRIFDAARYLADLESRPRLLLSERFDIARASGIDGVQLPEDGLPAADVRTCWPEALIGVSRHDASGVVERSAEADFILLGPVFETKTKPGEVPLGREEFARITSLASTTVLALGGVDETRIPDMLRAGAAGVAVRSAILDSRDPVQTARRIRSALDVS